jgi:hypothetical protein
MECVDVRSALPELLAVDRALRAGVEEHVVRCEACRREVAAVRGVLDLIARATAVPAPVEAPPFEELLGRVRSRRRVFPRILARAAVLLVAGLVGAAADRLSMHHEASPAAPPPAALAREEARCALSERPGGLGSSLAVLRVLALEPKH